MPELEQPLRFPCADLEEGHARKFTYEGADGRLREVVLSRVGGRLFAADSLCPHEGGRLAEGPLMEGRYYHCPLHLYRFDPATGASIGIECPPATTYRVEEERGEALVWFD